LQRPEGRRRFATPIGECRRAGYFLAPGGGSLGAARMYSSFFGAFLAFLLFFAAETSDASCQTSYPDWLAALV
jgi:hypothetical protein